MASTWNWIAKLAVIGSAVLLLSLGLCGYAIKNNGSDLAVIALVGMLVGGAGVAVAAIAAIVTALAGNGRKRTPPPPPPPPTPR